MTGDGGDQTGHYPPIVVRDPICHRCDQRTFVIFEGRPWYRPLFLEEVEGRPAQRSEQRTGGT